MMVDKNGIELKTGQVVKIEGAYFKIDNGAFRIAHSPNDPNWLVRDYSLRKVYVKGWQDSTCRGNVGFYPIMVTVSGSEMKRLAKEHNAKHVTIEVIGSVPMYKVVTQDRYRHDREHTSYMTKEEMQAVPRAEFIASEVMA